MFTWGKSYIPLENATYGLMFSDAAQYVGFENGDQIISVDNQKPNTLSDVTKMLLLDNPKEIVVYRNNQYDTLLLKEDNWKKLLGDRFCTFNFPFVIAEVVEGFPSARAGLQKEDSLVGINEDSMFLFSQFQDAFKDAKDSQIEVVFYRGDSLMTLPLYVNEEGKIGANVSPENYLKSVTEHYSFFQSIPKGIAEGVDNLVFYVKQFKRVFTKEGATQLGGFITIGSIFPKTWDWERFWSMTALLSVILAFMNILPIPALDGGYILFILVEMVTGRKPSDKFLGYANTVGFILLLGLLLYANGMDIFRFFK